MAYPRLTPIVTAGATTPRYLDERFSDVVNVKDYGAKGDGLTDDTAAIKAAVAAMKLRTAVVNMTTQAATAGPVLFFPYGVYLVSEQISISWAQRVGFFLDGATVRATAQMDCILYLNGNYQNGNVICGGRWDMNHIASCGIQITRSNAKFRLRDVTITGVGGGTGLYLGDSGATNRDGQEHMIENLNVVDFVSNDSDQNGSEIYDGIGIKVSVNDCQWNSVIVGCCKTAMQFTTGAGGHTLQNVHLWQRMSPANNRWKDTIGIEDKGDNNLWDGLYLDNMGIGYKSHVENTVSIGSVFYIKQQTPSDTTLAEPPIIFSGSFATKFRVHSLSVYLEHLSNDSNVMVFRNNSLKANSGNEIYAENIASACQIIKHNIRNTDRFKLFDVAFEMTHNKYAKSLAYGSAQAMTDGYYLLGILFCPGTGSCDFTVGIVSASAKVTVKKYGAEISLSSVPIITASTYAANCFLCVGEAETDPYYGVSYRRVYFRKNKGNSDTVYTNIFLDFEPHNSLWSFYKPNSNSILNSSIRQAVTPSVDVSIALTGEA